MEPSDVADLLRTLFASLPAGVTVSTRVLGEAVELEVALHAPDGTLEHTITGILDVIPDAPARLATYARAVATQARLLGPDDPDALLDLLSPSNILLQSVLDDDALQTEADFLAVLQDPDRLDRAMRVDQVMTLVQTRRPFNDTLLDALYALCWEGRSGARWPDTADALRTLFASGEDELVAECMAAWVEEYDQGELGAPAGVGGGAPPMRLR